MKLNKLNVLKIEESDQDCDKELMPATTSTPSVGARKRRKRDLDSSGGRTNGRKGLKRDASSNLYSRIISDSKSSDGSRDAESKRPSAGNSNQNESGGIQWRRASQRSGGLSTCSRQRQGS
jgi:hypothetical protein